MKKRLAILLSLLLIFCGCFEKTFEHKNLSFKGASSLDVAVGETKTLTAILPDNGVETTLSVASGSDILTASIADNSQLTLTGNAEGECELTFTLSADGYESVEAVYPVTVTLREIELSAFASGRDISKGLSLSRGETAEIEVECDVEDAGIALSTADAEKLEISGDGKSWSVTAKASGSTELKIAAEAENYAGKTLYIPVEIEKTAALLTLSQQSVSAVAGGSASVSFEAQPGGNVTASCDNGAASVAVEGGKVVISSAADGSFTVTVRCEAEDFIPSEQQFTAVFSKPIVPFTAPQSLSLESGSSASFTLGGCPEGTSFTVSSGGRLDVQLSGSSVTITAKAAGSDTLTIRAECPGYQGSSIKVPVTINAVTASVSSRYKSQISDIVALVNRERAAEGLSPLTYISDLEAGCAIRAEEASDRWSHTRPDGRDWDTVLYDTAVSFKAAGENLLDMNALDPDEAVDAWMDSPGHRANILRPNFNGTCVGIYKDGDHYYYAQHFIER